MRLRARREHTTLVRALDLSVHFDAGEEVRTEISAKFTPERLEGDLAAAGLELVRWFTDPDELFALTLSRVGHRHGVDRAERKYARRSSVGSRAMRIEHSSAIVVGGASGLGEATVRALHERGAVVTIADVNAEKGQALASELGLEFVSCDVREESQVQDAVQQAAGSGEGGLRIAVCCAGTGWAQKLAGSKGPHPLMPFETILQINLIGTFNVLRYAATAMIATSPPRTANAACS